MSMWDFKSLLRRVWGYFRSIPQEEPLFGPSRQFQIAVIKDYFDILKNAFVVVALQAAVTRTNGYLLYIIFNISYVALYIQIVIAVLRFSFRLFHRLSYRIIGLALDIVISWIIMGSLFATAFRFLNELMAEVATSTLK